MVRFTSVVKWMVIPGSPTAIRILSQGQWVSDILKSYWFLTFVFIESLKVCSSKFKVPVCWYMMPFFFAKPYNVFQLNAKGLKGKLIRGMCAQRFHTVFYSDDAVFTYGLNAGQMGKKPIIEFAWGSLNTNLVGLWWNFNILASRINNREQFNGYGIAVCDVFRPNLR